MIQIMIHGCNGKMGRAVAALSKEMGDIQVVCGVDLFPDSVSQDFPVYAAPQEIQETADVVVDFSRPEGLAKLLPWCTSHRIGLVLATTGLDQEELDMVQSAAQHIPIFRASNMSLGVNVLRSLATSAAVTLGDGFDIEILEKHHNQKVDAPSGTALTLAESITEAIGGVHPLVYGRHGRSAKRTRAEIGMHALRGGTVTGEHQVHFFGHNESICLTHIAQSRDVFAAGALAAARFLAGKAPGIYGMDELMQERRGGLVLHSQENLTYAAVRFSGTEELARFAQNLRQMCPAVVSQEQSCIGGVYQMHLTVLAQDTDAILGAVRTAVPDGNYTMVEAVTRITVSEPSIGRRVTAEDIACALLEHHLFPLALSIQQGGVICLAPDSDARSYMETLVGALS